MLERGWGRWPCLLLVHAGLASACTTGGQSGTEGELPTCRDGDSTPVGPDEATPAGTAVELAQASSAVQRHPLAWRRYYAPYDPLNHDTDVELTVSVDTGSARKIVQEPSPGVRVQECGVLLETNAVLRLKTDDGAFDGAFDGTLRVDSVRGYTIFAGSLPVGEHRGTYDLSDVAEPSLAVIRLYAGLAPSANGHLIIETGDGRPAPEYSAAEWPEHAVSGTGLTDGGR
jgi:hypothetical protein